MARGKKEILEQDEVVKKFMEAPINLQEEKPQEATDTVVLSNKRKLKILPTKLKYFKSGDYGVHRVIKEIGVAELLNYSDGMDLVCRFLSAVFDKPYTVEEIKNEENGEYNTKNVFDAYVMNLVDDELNIKDLMSIVDISLKVNGIETENF